MIEKRRRNNRQTIELEQLANDPNSFLSWSIDDPALRKLETYRLYQNGEYAVADIAEAFGFSHGYLYEMWGKFEEEGVEAMVDKRWGANPRKRTSTREAEVLRSKALNPEKGDSTLAKEFDMERSTIYRLLKEHGLQDLHQVIAGADKEQETSADSEGEGSEKKGPKLSHASNRFC
jgi:transposase